MFDDETIKIMCPQFFELEERVKILEEKKYKDYIRGCHDGIKKAIRIVYDAEARYEAMGYKHNCTEGPLKFVVKELNILINK